MALGTISRSLSAFGVGNRKMKVFDVQLTNGANYTTGGETIMPSQVGLRRIDAVLNGGSARLTSNGSTSIPIAMAHQADGSVKLQAYVAATGAEQAASANLSTFSTRLTFIGF